MQAFDAHARQLVAAMFSVYITGGFTYILRDMIVRVFYTIGNSACSLSIASVKSIFSLFLPR